MTLSRNPTDSGGRRAPRVASQHDFVIDWAGATRIGRRVSEVMLRVPFVRKGSLPTTASTRFEWIHEVRAFDASGHGWEVVHGPTGSERVNEATSPRRNVLRIRQRRRAVLSRTASTHLLFRDLTDD